MRLLTLLILFTSILVGQTTTITATGPATALPGGIVIATLTIAGPTPTDSGSVATQWTLTYPSNIPATSVVGAPSSGKTITCSTDFSTCLLSALDIAPMPNGALAQYTFKIPSNQPPGPVTFPLVGLIAVGVIGAAPNVDAISLPVVSGAVYTVLIQQLIQDLNGDGKVDLTDVQLMTSEAINSITDPTTCKHDQNGDGKCDVLDVTKVILKALGVD